MKRTFLFISSLVLLLAFSGCKVYRQNIMFQTEANRLPEGLSAPVRAAVQDQLSAKRLEQRAAGYMEELRSEARIEIK